MPTISTLTAVLNLDKSGFESNINDAQDDLDGLGGRAQEVGDRLSSAGKTLTAGLTLPLAGVAAQSARTAAGFEQAMSESMAVMGDVSDEMEEKLEQRAREMAKTTTLSAEEAASSYYYLASAGLDAAQSLEAMPQVAAFAEAGQMDMAEATDVATNVMSAYNMEASELNEVTDTMVETVTNHNQTVEGMADAFRNAAPAAASMGVEMEELAALTGALGDVGIQGAEAGTALNSIMRRFAKRSGEAGQVLDELNIQTTDAQGNLLSLTEIFDQLEDANLSAAEASALFGRQQAAGNALLEMGSEELSEYEQQIGEADDSTQEMAEDMRDNFNAQLQMARDQLADAGITIGSEVLPHLSMLVNLVSGAAQWFGNLSSRQQTTIVAIGGLLAVIGPLLAAMGFMVTNAVAAAGALGTLGGAVVSAGGFLSGMLLPSTVAAQGGLTGLAASAMTATVSLGALTAPVWAVLAALGALVAGIVAFAAAYQRNWKGVRDATDQYIEPILDGIDFLIDKIFGISDATGKVGSAFGDFLDWVMNALDKLPGVNVDDGSISFDADMPDSELEGNGESALGAESGAGDMMPSKEELGIDQETFEQQGEDAGQSFSSGFSSGLVEDLETSDVESFLQNEIDAQTDEVSAMEDRLKELERIEDRGIISDQAQQELETLREDLPDARSELETLESQLADVQEAENVTELNSDLVADVAEQELQSDREDAEAIQEIYDELENRDIDVESDIDPEQFDEVNVESQVEELMAQGDGEGSGQQSKLETLKQLLNEQKATREAVSDQEVLVEIVGDLERLVEEIRTVVREEKRSDARRNRGGRGA